MDEEALNMSIRKFLKKVGITSQREIERALNQADQDGELDGSPVQVKMTLECDLIDGGLSIEEENNYLSADIMSEERNFIPLNI